MTFSAHTLVRVVLSEDDEGLQIREVEDAVDIADVVGVSGKRETITLSNGFTALSPPSGAHAVIIRPSSGAFTYTLKGVTGDTGIVMSTTTLLAHDVVIPLGTSPSIGIACTGAAVIECVWL